MALQHYLFYFTKPEFTMKNQNSIKFFKKRALNINKAKDR